MKRKRPGTVLLTAYACCPGKGTEPGFGWNYLLQYAAAFEHVILVTSVPNHLAVQDKLLELGIRNVSMKVVRLKFSLEKLHYMPIGGIHIHYFLWLRKALSLIRSLPDKIDFAHHLTYGSLQFGSPLYKLECPFIFGPVGGGQRMNKVFYPLMGKARYLESIRNIVSFLFYRFNPFFKGTMRQASIIYCANEDTRAAAARYVPPARQDKIKMMTDVSLDARFLADRLPRHKNNGTSLNALWVGRLLPRKGLEILLNTVKLLKGEHFQLTIVGDGPLRDKTLAFIKDNGLEDIVHFVGWVDHRQILEYYQAADILLFLSYRDSTGQQIIEALSQGVPVLSLDQFGASLVINENVGFKIPLEDDLATLQESIAHAVRQLVRDPARLKTMSLNAAAYAHEFTWEHKMDRILHDIQPFLKDLKPLIHDNADVRLERV